MVYRRLNGYFTFFTKKKLQFSLICSFCCCLMKEGLSIFCHFSSHHCIWGQIFGELFKIFINDDELINYFCGMVDRRKMFSLISTRDHCQRSSPRQNSDTVSRIWICAESEFRICGTNEWSSAIVITTTTLLDGTTDNH